MKGLKIWTNPWPKLFREHAVFNDEISLVGGTTCLAGTALPPRDPCWRDVFSLWLSYSLHDACRHSSYRFLRSSDLFSTKAANVTLRPDRFFDHIDLFIKTWPSFVLLISLKRIIIECVQYTLSATWSQGLYFSIFCVFGMGHESGRPGVQTIVHTTWCQESCLDLPLYSPLHMVEQALDVSLVFCDDKPKFCCTTKGRLS